MATSRHLNAPPIKEAAISIVFACSEPTPPSVLEQLASPYVERGWKLHELTRTEVPLGQDGDDVTEVEPVFDGVGVFDGKKSQFIQFRPSRLTLSDLTSYAGWESLTERLREVFALYAPAVLAESVMGIGTRFINRITSVEGDQDYAEVLSRPPLPLPGEGLEGARISDFLRRHAVEGLGDDLRATLTIGTVRPEAGEVTTHTKAIAIDIEVFKTGVMPLDFDKLTLELNRLRVIKNALFFGSLTDRAVGRFE